MEDRGCDSQLTSTAELLTAWESFVRGRGDYDDVSEFVVHSTQKVVIVRTKFSEETEMGLR